MINDLPYLLCLNWAKAVFGGLLCRDFMMNSRYTNSVKKTKWQNIVIIFVLLFMLISALPNLYSDKLTVNLVSNNSQNEPISAQTIKRLLAKHQLTVDEIKTSTEGSAITLANETDQVAVETLLTEQFAENYSVASSVENNAPTWLKSFNGQPIKLGLDLSGGVLFVLDVDTERALFDKLKDIALDVKSLAIADRIHLSNVSQPNNYTITFDFNISKQSAVEKLLTKVTKIYPEFSQSKIDNNQVTLAYSSQEQVKFRQETMNQTLKTMRGRIEELGITEAVTQKQGKNRIRIELPGVHDPEEAKRIIGATASLDFYQLAENSNAVGILQMTDNSGRQ